MGKRKKAARISYQFRRKNTRRRAMRYNALCGLMICRACGLDKKIPFFGTRFFGVDEWTCLPAGRPRRGQNSPPDCFAYTRRSSPSLNKNGKRRPAGAFPFLVWMNGLVFAPKIFRFSGPPLAQTAVCGSSPFPVKQKSPLPGAFVVWMNGLEPTTPCMSSKCSNQLSYTHVFRLLGYSIT